MVQRDDGLGVGPEGSRRARGPAARAWLSAAFLAVAAAAGPAASAGAAEGRPPPGDGGHARMDAARARDLLAADTVTADGVVGTQPAGEAEVRALVSEATASGPPRTVAPEVVIGRDQRTEVANTRRLPFRSLGELTFQVGALGSSCSGTLVGPRHVLTAGHCVFDTVTRRFHRSFRFAPARDGGLLPYGTFSGVKALAPVGYTRDGLMRFDYALLVLDRPPPSGIPRVAYGAGAVARLDGLSLGIVGYPFDKPAGTMWRSACSGQGPGRDGLLRYDCDTAPGMSGGPVLDVTGAGPLVVAVHGFGDFAGAINSGAPLVAAARLQIQAWIAAN